MSRARYEQQGEAGAYLFVGCGRVLVRRTAWRFSLSELRYATHRADVSRAHRPLKGRASAGERERLTTLQAQNKTCLTWVATSGFRVSNTTMSPEATDIHSDGGREAGSAWRSGRETAEHDGVDGAQRTCRPRASRRLFRGARIEA